MVLADNMRAFSLTLTDASTGEECREYVDTMGTTWVKGEKGDEFFLMLKNQDTRDALCRIFVDGVDLGYSYTMPRTRTSAPLGILKSGQAWADSDLIAHSSGSVTVQWYNCTWEYNSVTSEATTTSTLTNDPKGPTTRCGELLATTTVQYTSDVGLAVRGLLSADETGTTAKRRKTVVVVD